MFGFGNVEIFSTYDAQSFYTVCYALKGSQIKHTTDVGKDTEAGAVKYTISVKKKDAENAKAVASRITR